MLPLTSDPSSLIPLGVDTVTTEPGGTTENAALIAASVLSGGYSQKYSCALSVGPSANARQ